jgi:hypothetical protein
VNQTEFSCCQTVPRRVGSVYYYTQGWLHKDELIIVGTLLIINRYNTLELGMQDFIHTQYFSF